MRRALFISYHSPPYAGPPAFRAAQILKHLPSNGWQPLLLTAPPSSYGDDSGPVEPTAFKRPESAIATRTVWLGGLGAKVKRASAPAGTPSSSGPDQSVDGQRSEPSLLARIAATVATPDRLVPWIPFAVAAGLRAARESDVICAAGPPFTNHLVGLWLKRLTGKPLVVLVDDPWASMGHRVWHSKAQQRLTERQERRSLLMADAIIACTPGFEADIANRYGAEVASKMSMARFGYDQDDLPAGPEQGSRSPDEPVRFVYTGSLRGEQYDSTGLFEALAELLRTLPSLHEHMTLDVYGSKDDAISAQAHALGLNRVMRFHGFKPHREIAAAVASSDVGIVLINDTQESFRWYESIKLCTYAGARLPVLALVPPDGYSARLIRERRLGLIVSPHDREGIANAIRQMWTQHNAIRDDIADCSDLSSAASGAIIANALSRAAGTPVAA